MYNSIKYVNTIKQFTSCMIDVGLICKNTNNLPSCFVFKSCLRELAIFFGGFGTSNKVDIAKGPNFFQLSFLLFSN